MMDSDWVLMVAVGLLLLASAFFSGSETALTAASRARLHTLAQQGNRRAAIVEQLWSQRERVIGALLLGNNVVNISSSALATSLLISWFGDAGVAYATGIMTVLVVIFSEILPKTYALHHADRAVLALAPAIWWVVWVLSPAARTLGLAVTLILRLMRVSRTHSAEEHEERAEEELRGAIDLHANQEEPHERQMLSSILDLAEVEVGEIMTHRKEVVAIDADLSADEIVEAVLASPYTRLPLWRGEPDNIVGVLHAKRLLRALQVSQASGKPLDILTVAQSPWFIPETTDLLAQLRAFQQRHEHFALVVDEYGVFEGVVTLEDILEEIVGEIADEHDLKIEGLKRESDGSYIVDGRLTIRDLNRQFGWRLPDEEASTIAGLVLYEARTIPQVGQAFAFHGFKFDILGRQRHQITSLRITPLQDEASSAGK